MAVIHSDGRRQAKPAQRSTHPAISQYDGRHRRIPEGLVPCLQRWRSRTLGRGPVLGFADAGMKRAGTLCKQQGLIIQLANAGSGNKVASVFAELEVMRRSYGVPQLLSLSRQSKRWSMNRCMASSGKAARICASANTSVNVSRRTNICQSPKTQGGESDLVPNPQDLSELGRLKPTNFRGPVTP